MSQQTKLVHGTMTIDITPAWWGSGMAELFQDMADVVREIGKMSMERHGLEAHAAGTAQGHDLLCEVIDIIVGVHGAKLVLGMDTSQTVASTAREQEEIVERLNKLAVGCEHRSRIIAAKAEVAADRARRTNATKQASFAPLS